MTLEHIVMLLIGYAIGKTPFVVQYLKTRSENIELKKDVIVLKEHLTKTGRGKIINTVNHEKD